MATETVRGDTASDRVVEEQHATHPTPALYVQIAAALAIVTAMEVALFYIDVGVLFVPALIVLMIVKFVMVVGFYMHLKFDSPVFRRMLVSGLAIAISVFIAVLAMFQVFSGEPEAALWRAVL